MTYTLIIWFSLFANYSYTPVVVGQYYDKGSCEAALTQFIEASERHYPEGVCLEGPPESQDYKRVIKGRR